jgi:2'-5' RNA ligase
MRTFIAVDFPPEIISKVAKIIEYFKTQTPEKAMKWVPVENLHLTVKFLGDVPEARLEQVENIISGSLKGIPPFKVEVGGLGIHPNKHKPRVIWLNIACEQTLMDIHQNLNHALADAGIEPDNRVYSPHLTIARIRDQTVKETRQGIGRTLAEFKVDKLGEVTINEVILYKSELTRAAPVYSPILRQPLNQV